MPSSRLFALCDRMLEAGWLTALLITPLFFSMDSRRGFEPDKLALLRSLATFMSIVWLIRWIEQPRASGFRMAWHANGLWMLCTLLLVVVYLLTTITSIVPAISFWGSYTRLQGTYTTFSYAIIFFVIISSMRTRLQLNRLILTIILASVPVSLYGMVRHFGWDPLWEQGGGSSRVFSTMGNPVYLAAYLTMVFFLTLYKMLESLGTQRSEERIRSVRLLGFSSYALIASVQLIATIFTSSRGPFLGWLGGVAFFVLGLAILSRRKQVMLGLVGLTIIGLLLLVVVNLPGTPLAGMRGLPNIGRMLTYTGGTRDSMEVRSLIWEGSAQLMQPNSVVRYPDGTPDSLQSLRLWVGYGPESMYLIFGQFFPPALGLIYPGDTLVGRSHNEMWDALINSGIIGALAYQFLFFCFFFASFKTLGLIRTYRERNLFAGLWWGLGALGTLSVFALNAVKFLGIAVPAATLIAIIAFLLWSAIQHSVRDREDALLPSDRVLVVALIAGILSHYIETQVGFGVASTRLLLWTFAAIIAVVASKTIEKESAESLNNAGHWVGVVSGYAVVVGLALVTLLQEFVTNTQGLTNPLHVLWQSLTVHSLYGQPAYTVLGMVAIFWALALCVVLVELMRARVFKSSRAVLGGAMEFTLISLGLAFIFGLGRANRQIVLAQQFFTNVQDVVAAANYRAGLLDYYWVSVILLVFLTGLALMTEYRHLPRMWSTRRVSLILCLVLIPAASGAIDRLNLNPIRADIIFNLAQAQNLDAAIALYKNTIDRTPNEDVYYRGLGYALIGKADLARGDDSVQASRFNDQTSFTEIWNLSAGQMAMLSRLDLMYAARAVFTRARELNSLNADHTASLARLDNQLAGMIDDPNQQAKFVKRANQLYAQAVSIRPSDVNLWNDWAALNPYREAIHVK